MDGCFAITFYIYVRKVALGYLERFEFYREFGHAVFAESDAGFDERTKHAVGRGWGTLDGTEVHDGLIILRGRRKDNRGWRLARRESFLGHGGEEFFALGGVDGGIDAEVAGEHTINVAIDHCCRDAKGKAGDGRGGVITHAFQLLDVL